MSRTVDPELSALIQEAVDADLLNGSRGAVDVARRVADSGQASLSPDDRDIWEAEVLPVLARPLDLQIAVRAVLRRGGRVLGGGGRTLRAEPGARIAGAAHLEGA